MVVAIDGTHLVFLAVCVASNDIESTQSICELLSIGVVTLNVLSSDVVRTAVVEDVDQMFLNLVTRDG